MGEFKLGRMTLKSLFSKPATKLYPIEAPQYYERTKGHVVINTDLCRFDGSCANLCPTGALDVDRKALTWAIDRFKCIQCRNCIEVCAEDALTMDPLYAEPSAEHTVSVYEVTSEDRARRERIAAEKAANIEVCAEDALTMDPLYAEPSAEHTVSVYEVTSEDRARRERIAAEKAAKAAKLKEEALAKKKAAAAAAAKEQAE